MKHGKTISSYSVPENRFDRVETRRDADDEFIVQLCQDVFSVKIKECDICKQFRLGAFSRECECKATSGSFKGQSIKDSIMYNLI